MPARTVPAGSLSCVGCHNNPMIGPAIGGCMCTGSAGYQPAMPRFVGAFFLIAADLKNAPRNRGMAGLIACATLQLELDALRERELVRPVDGVGLAAHVGLPGVAPGFAAAAGFL